MEEQLACRFPKHLRWDGKTVAGPTVKMIAHCMTYITGEILGRFNKWFCLLSRNLLFRELWTRSWPWVCRDYNLIASAQPSLYCRGHKAKIPQYVQKTRLIKISICAINNFFLLNIFREHCELKLEISSPYSYNVAGDMGMILTRATITSFHFLYFP